MGYPRQIHTACFKPSKRARQNLGHGSCKELQTNPKSTVTVLSINCLRQNFEVPLNFKSINSLAKSYTWTEITSSTCVAKLKRKQSFWPNKVPYAAENSNCILCPLLIMAGALLRWQEQAHSHHNKCGAAALYRKSAQHSHTVQSWFLPRA